MPDEMPELLSAALFARGDAALAAHRRAGRAPFGGQWLLPLTRVARDETAEEAVARHAREQFGVTLASEVFFDTVYIEDPDDGRRYVANIFRVTIGDEPLRFRGDGDYDDARWLTAPDIETLWMPPDLRAAVVRGLTEPIETQMTWGDAVPLAERADDAPPPDNHAAWAAIAAAYQREHGFLDPKRLRWGTGVYEDDVGILGDVRGQRAIVLGCGDGRDVVALAAMGAIATGVDFVPAQITTAQRLAVAQGIDNAALAVADVTDLVAFGDASFDVAVSLWALDFVEDAAAAVGEAARVLRGGGVLAIAMGHPWNQMFTTASPYSVVRPYWPGVVDTNWDESQFGDEGVLRTWRRTIEDWVAMLTAAGFAIERIVEPHAGDVSGDEAIGHDTERARLMPQTLIIKARKRE